MENKKCDYCNRDVRKLILKRDGKSYCSLACLEMAIWKTSEESLSEKR